MSLSHSPSIVINGLVLALDAGNIKSYTGSGTTWTDLSLNSNTGTLVGGPSYGSTSGGSIAFDGLNDNVSIGTNRFSFDSSPGTLSAWAKTTSLYPDRAIVSYGASVINQARILGIAASNFYFSGYGSTITASGASYDDWFNIVGVYDGTNASMYVNGALVAGPTLQSWNTAASNAGIGKNVGNDGYWRGNVSQVSVYNRALSAAEIQQNYNALKSRYYTYVSEAYIRDPEEPPAPFEYWIATLGNVRGISLVGIRVDSLGNIYCCGTISATSSESRRGILVKYDQYGTFKWQRTFFTSTNTAYGAGSNASTLDIDSSGNVYVCTSLDGDIYGQQYRENVMIKYNSSGVLQWNVGIPAGNYQYCRIVVDNSGKIYTSNTVYSRASDFSSIFAYAIFIKYNSSGMVEWQRTLTTNVESTNSYTQLYASSIAVDGSGNLYVISTEIINSRRTYLAKYDSLGALQWKIKFGSTTGAGAITDITVDAAGQYIYGCGFGITDGAVTKFNTSGQVIWQKIIYANSVGNSQVFSFYNIKIDTSGEYLYVGGRISKLSPNQNYHYAVLLKLNISGETIWCKTLGKSPAIDANEIFGMASDSSGNFYGTVGHDSNLSNSHNDSLVIKLPGDGSLTGTYGDYNYANLAASVTNVFFAGVSTYVTSAAGLTNAATGFSTYTSSLITSETSTLTYSTISVS